MSVWFNILLCIVTAILPDLVIKVWENLYDVKKIVERHELFNPGISPNAYTNNAFDYTDSSDSLEMKNFKYEEFFPVRRPFNFFCSRFK